MSNSEQNIAEVNAITIRDLIYRYNKSMDPVLNIKDWQVQTGQHVFVHGRSGTGKSTLLNLLAGILSSQQGSIEIFGHSLSALSARQRDAFRAKHIGMVFQQFNLVSYLSVLDNIQLAAHFSATSSEVVRQRCIELFKYLKLDIDLLNRQADSLSVGQQQRVAIVRAFINEPRLLIVDEPTSALDSEAKAGFMQLLMPLIEQADTTLIFVSHDETLRPFFSHHISMSDLNCLDVEHVN